MGIRINTNSTALTAYRYIGRASSTLQTSVERLSSGLRINHAQDDPAGLAIAEKIQTQVLGLQRASMNAQDGTSLLQTAESALGEVTSMLHRIRELAIQAANGTLTSADRVEIQREIDQLLDEIDRTAQATEFNTKSLLDGTASALVSVDDAGLTPIVTGDKVDEGNYRLEMEMTPGQAQVLKSDIFQILAGEQYKLGTRGMAEDILAVEDVMVYTQDDGAGNTNIILRRLDGSEATITTTNDASNPQLSPDGMSIVYTRTSAAPADNLYIYDLETQTERQVTNWAAAGTGANEARWSSDGSQLLYVGTAAGNTNVYVLSANATTPQNGTQITADNDVVAGSASWSPTTKRVLYDSLANGVMIIDSDGTDAVTVADATFANPEWSPDGTRVLLEDPGANDDVWIYDIASGTRTNITQNLGAGPTCTQATWSPDGTRLAMVYDDGGGNLDIRVMNADGSYVRDLISGATNYLQAAAPLDLIWSSDGNYVYFEGTDGGGDQQLYRISTDGSVVEEQITTAAIDSTEMSFGRSGYWVAEADRPTSADFTLWQDMDWSTNPDDDTFPGSPNTSQDYRIQHEVAPATTVASQVVAGAATFGGAGTVTVVVQVLDAGGAELGRSRQIQATLAAGTDEIDLDWEPVAGAATYRVWFGDADAGITGYNDVAAPATATTLAAVPGAAATLPTQKVAGDRFGVTDYDIRERWNGFTVRQTGVLGSDTYTNQAPYIVLEVVGVRVTNNEADYTISGDQMVIDDSLIDTTTGEYMQRVQLRATTYTRDGEVLEQTSFEMDASQWTSAQDVLNGSDFADLDGNYQNTTVTFGQNGDVVSVQDKIVLLYDNVDQYTNGVVWTSQNTTDLGSFSLDTDGYNVRYGLETDRIGARAQAPKGLDALPGVTYEQSLAWIDLEGTVHIGTGEYRFAADPTGSTDFNLTESTLAERVTSLQYVDRFALGSGSIFDVNAQELTMYAAGRSADIVLQASDTLEEVAAKFRSAMTTSIALGGLGLGVDGDDSLAGVDGNTSVYVSNEATATDEAVAGTLLLRSTLPGMDGRIFFSGDDRLIDGFSFAEVVAPTINNLDVTVYDAHSGELIGSQSVNDSVLRSIISGVDVNIRQDADVRVEWNAQRKRFEFYSGFGKDVMNLHVVDNSLSLQIGANPGQSLQARIGAVTRESLQLEDVLVVDRDVAEAALTQIDYAVNYVNSQRARIGAYINRLETTVNILDITQENLTASESRIRDLDMAQETINFTKDQILVQAATAMLAQANTLPQSVLQLLQ